HHHLPPVRSPTPNFRNFVARAHPPRCALPTPRTATASTTAAASTARPASSSCSSAAIAATPRTGSARCATASRTSACASRSDWPALRLAAEVLRSPRRRWRRRWCSALERRRGRWGRNGGCGIGRRGRSGWRGGWGTWGAA
ncbi:hypothetical protein EDC01DRAFT_787551, partial [Geopyxis carbonaria]